MPRTDRGGKPAAPKDVPAEGRRLWAAIVAQYPPDYFAGANAALLESLCRSHALIRECDVLVAEQGAFVEGAAHPALAVRAAERRSFMALATKLRLSISATLGPKADAARPDQRHALPKPWERKR